MFGLKWMNLLHSVSLMQFFKGGLKTKMQSGGKKYEKVVKTKHRKNDRDEDLFQKNKQKHHDKTYYRLRREEQKVYG